MGYKYFPTIQKASLRMEKLRKCLLIRKNRFILVLQIRNPHPRVPFWLSPSFCLCFHPFLSLITIRFHVQTNKSTPFQNKIQEKEPLKRKKLEFFSVLFKPFSYLCAQPLVARHFNYARMPMRLTSSNLHVLGTTHRNMINDEPSVFHTTTVSNLFLGYRQGTV